jgi:cytochrome d ubiquinol oxidase subunit II
MVTFWVAVLATSILLYVLLDGFDLGVGILFGLTRSAMRRRAMLSAVAPIWDGNETWLVVSGVVLWGAFPIVYAVLLSAFYLPVLVMLAGLILRGWRSSSATRPNGCGGSGTPGLPAALSSPRSSKA